MHNKRIHRHKSKRVSLFQLNYIQLQSMMPSITSCKTFSTSSFGKKKQGKKKGKRDGNKWKKTRKREKKKKEAKEDKGERQNEKKPKKKEGKKKRRRKGMEGV